MSWFYNPGKKCTEERCKCLCDSINNSLSKFNLLPFNCYKISLWSVILLLHPKMKKASLRSSFSHTQQLPSKFCGSSSKMLPNFDLCVSSLLLTVTLASCFISCHSIICSDSSRSGLCELKLDFIIPHPEFSNDGPSRKSE